VKIERKVDAEILGYTTEEFMLPKNTILMREGDRITPLVYAGSLKAVELELKRERERAEDVRRNHFKVLLWAALLGAAIGAVVVGLSWYLCVEAINS
jgi:hypothetical protein